MHRSVVALGALLLIIGVGPVVTAQSPPASPNPSPGSQRVAVPEAGVALAFPDDWLVRVPLVRHAVVLPPGLEGTTEAYVWDVVEAYAPDDRSCQLLRYGDHPLALRDHADWIMSALEESPDSAVETASSTVSLPAGDAIRLDFAGPEGTFTTGYLIESADTRYQLRCFGSERPEDDWRSVADTMEFIPIEVSGLSLLDASTLDERVDLVRDFRTVVSVVDPATPGFPDASLMTVDCEFALRIEAADGSAKEWLACTLSDDPVEPPEQQGTRPATAITTAGGPCVWQSDYWSVRTGRQVVASAFEVTVTPGGQVFGWSTYPAEPVDCRVE